MVSSTPVPLTVACVTAIFCPSGAEPKFIVGTSPCMSPRIADPCPGISWPTWTCPKKFQMIEIAEAISSVANVGRIHFLPPMIVVKLVYGDGRHYPNGSLPGRIAEVSVSYHHDSSSLFKQLKDRKRERLLNSMLCLPRPLIGALPQDAINYLKKPE